MGISFPCGVFSDRGKRTMKELSCWNFSWPEVALSWLQITRAASCLVFVTLFPCKFPTPLVLKWTATNGCKKNNTNNMGVLLAATCIVTRTFGIRQATSWLICQMCSNSSAVVTSVVGAVGNGVYSVCKASAFIWLFFGVAPVCQSRDTCPETSITNYVLWDRARSSVFNGK